MPPFQNSEAIRPDAGNPGKMADMAEWNANSGFIQGTTLRPGHPVQKGSAPRTFAPLTTGNFQGILRDHITAAPGGVFTEGEMVAAIDEGHIFVRPGGVCTMGNPVFWNTASNGGQGGFSNAGGVRILGAEFRTSAAASDPVVIVNLRKIPGGIPAA